MTDDKLQGLLPLQPADLQILMMLTDGPMHAYGLAQSADDERLVRLEIGSLYRVISRMLRTGLIDELPPDSSASGNAAKRKNYRITRLGRRVVRAEVQRIAQTLRAAADRQLIDIRGVMQGE